MALAQLGLERGPRLAKDQIPVKLGVGNLPDGWLVFFAEDPDLAFHANMVALSKLGPAVGCVVEEHVMFAEARGFADGLETWRVTHNPDKSLRRLETAGTPPSGLAALHAEYSAQQDAEGGQEAGVDLIFEVPLEVASTVCAFRHDKAWPEGFVFTELRRPGAQDAPRRRPGLFATLFGRR